MEPKSQRFEDLLEKCREIVMTPEELEAQRRSFAYGNLKIDKPSVTREDIDRAVEELERQRNRHQ